MILIQKYPCVKLQTCSQLESKWAKSDRGRGRDKGHTMHNISSDVSSSDIITTMVIWLNFVQAYQRRWGVPQDEGSLWGGMIGLHQVFDDQMYPPGQTMPRSKLLLPGLSSWCITLSMTTSPLTFPSWPLFFKSNAFSLFCWLSNFRALVSHNSELQCYTQRSHQYMWQTFCNKETVWFIKLPNNQILSFNT